MKRNYRNGDVVLLNESATGEELAREISDALARGDFSLWHYLEYGRWPRQKSEAEKWAHRARYKKLQRRLTDK